MKFPRAAKLFQIVLIATFFVIIWVPLLEIYLPLAQSMSSTEKRKLTGMPMFHLSHFYTFLTEYEKYFNDNFGFRNNLIAMNNSLLVKAFHHSPITAVIIGKNGWLFYTTNGASALHSIPYDSSYLRR